MAGLWSSCPCTSISWTSSFRRAGPLGGGQGISRSRHCELPIQATGLAPGDCLPCGVGGRSHSGRTGLRIGADVGGKKLHRSKRVFLDGEGPNSRVKKIGRNAGLAATKEATQGEVGSPLPKGATEEDAEYMRMAVQLARKAIGQTSPNPMVGCVIVKDGQIVGRGFHPKAGEPHAEVFALREAGEKAKGGTAYVSLEPCNHTGRTPPCSQALVQAEVKRVVVGTVDPNPLVGGKGVQTLLKAGIEVVVGVEEALCQATAETFFHRITAKKPFVTLRYMMSLDGALLGSCEDGTEAGSHFSLLLQEHDAVVITDACVYDDPRLLSSEPGAKQPLRVVLAKSLDLPMESQVFDTNLAPTLVLTDQSALMEDVELSTRKSRMSSDTILRSKGVEVVVVNEATLDYVLDLLYQRGFNSVLLDSRGPESSGLENYLGQRAVIEQAAQKLVVAIQPVIAGSTRGGLGFSIEGELLRLERVSTRMEGGNVTVEGYFPNR
ncbi:unnamed protein product [Calypogeia fissa]